MDRIDLSLAEKCKRNVHNTFYPTDLFSFLFKLSTLESLSLSPNTFGHITVFRGGQTEKGWSENPPLGNSAPAPVAVMTGINVPITSRDEYIRAQKGVETAEQLLLLYKE